MLSSFTFRLEGQNSFSPSPSPVPASCHSSLATAPVSPFPANLLLIALAKSAAPPQLTENKAALSPASINLDAASSLTPLFATLTENTPGGAAPSPSGLSPFLAMLTKNIGSRGAPCLLDRNSSLVLHALCDKYHFRRTVRQRRLVEIPVYGAHAKPAARQQVFHLVPEEIAQRPRKHQTLFFPMPILHIKNHFHVISLLRAVERFHTFHDSHLPPVWHRVLRHQPFLLVRGVVHPLRVRLENVQDQPPAALAEPPASCPQMLSHGFKAGNLRVNLEKMLHRAKRNDDHAEFFAEIEPCHVALHEMKAFARFRRQRRAFFVAALQHPLGNIESGYAMPVRCQRQRDPSRAAAQLKHGVAIFMRRASVKRDIPRSSAHHRRLIVVVCNKSVVESLAHKLRFIC